MPAGWSLEAVELSDAADPRLADYVGLTDPALRVRVEAAGGFFVVEGILAIEQLLARLDRWDVRSVLLTPKALARLRPTITGARLAAPVLVAPPDVLRATVGFDLHRGAVASVRRPPSFEVADVVSAARRALLVEAVNDHENLGALFRAAAAFGVDAVLLDPTTADPLYRRAVRVSMGHVLGVPFARTAPWPGAIVELRSRGWTVVALTPAGDEDIATLAGARRNGGGGRPVAVAVGAEGPGLSAPALAAADHRARIPMAAGVDSLNVATAAAIALHRLFEP